VRQRLTELIGANRVVMALSTARLADAVGNSILFVVIPLYVAQLPSRWLRLPETVLVGILVSLYGFVNAAVQPIVGAISDRIGRRKPLIVLGLGLMTLATFGFSLATRFIHLLAIRVLQGIGVALTVPTSMALMATATETRSRGGSMGIYTSMRMIGLSAGPLAGGFLLDRYGFDTTFYLGAALVLVGLLLVQFWVKEPRAAARHGPREPFRIIDPSLLSPAIIGLALATCFMAMAFTEMVSLERQFNQRLGEQAFGFGLAFSALMVSRLVFQIPLGSLSDRIGRKPLVLAGLVLMAPATAILGLAASNAQLVAFRLLQGLASAAIAAPAFAMAMELSREGGEGRQLSIVTMGFGLGIATGPLLAGLLAVIGFELPFAVGGSLALLGAWIVWRQVPETVPHLARAASDARSGEAA
jgi:MFS family permease